MKKNNISLVGIYVLLPAAVLLACAFAILLVRQEHTRRMSEIEYRTFQILTGVLEQYRETDRFDPLVWPEIRAFGLYNFSGALVFQHGDVPPLLEPRSVSLRGKTIRSGSSLILLRWVGTVPAPGGGGPNDVPGLRRGFNPRKYTFVFVEVDVSLLLAAGRLFYISLYVLLAVFIVILGFLANLTRRLTRYRKREESHIRLVQLGEAARTLVHEIKNPLGVIRIQCATLRKTVPEERMRNLGIIEEETARLATLADRVREFLQLSEGSPEKRNAGWFITQCAERWEGRLETVIQSGKDVSIYIDPAQLLQVLDNLVMNALESGAFEQDLPQLSLSFQSGRICFEVSDRGHGVPIENRERIFEPFFTTKARGSGIGLALSRRYIEQAGGTLNWVDHSGGGSRFVVVLPTSPSKI